MGFGQPGNWYPFRHPRSKPQWPLDLWLIVVVVPHPGELVKWEIVGREPLSIDLEERRRREIEKINGNSRGKGWGYAYPSFIAAS